MFKELILAIIIGAILGFGITGGYMTTQHKSSVQKKEQVVVEPTLVPTINQESSNQDSEKEESDSLKIDTPEDNALLNSDKVSISGTTSKNSIIVITTSTNSFTGKSDNSGNFKISITLESGLNIVKITSIDANNIQKDKSINITYSTAKI